MALVVATALAGVCLLLCAPGEVKAADGSYIDFGKYDSYKALAAGTEEGVTFEDGSARLARGRTSGTLTSPVYASSHKDTFVPSWNARTPPKTFLRVEIRVLSAGNWTRWWQMGVWAKGTGTVKRHSVDGQKAGDPALGGHGIFSVKSVVPAVPRPKRSQARTYTSISAKNATVTRL